MQKYILILLLSTFSGSVFAASEIGKLVDDCSIADQEELKKRLQSGEKIETEALMRAIGRGNQKCFWIINSEVASFSQNDLDIMLLTASEGAFNGYLSVVKELVGKGANPIRIYMGEIRPKNAIGQVLFSQNDSWSKDAKLILNYLLNVVSEKTGETKKSLLEKYGYKFQEQVEESY